MFGFEDKSLLKEMCSILRHRGPDESGTFTDKNVGLGHVRLSIIDLETGRQPIYNEDESIAIVYNGEIYNFRDLREELEAKGHRFYTKTDTEVIVHAYEEYGFDCVKKFNGMFAFALWDSNKKHLFLGRDRSGIKPIYYTFLDDGTFLFASEVKAILLSPEIVRKLDMQAFHHYVNLRYVFGERTIFDGIKKLPAGHTAVVNQNGIKIKKYWDLEVKIEDYSEDYLIKKIPELLKEAVTRHMISDVPVGIYLSSGIDSSALVALASQLSEEPVKTFTMTFGEPGDEHIDSRLVAEVFWTDHHEIPVEENNLLKDYPEMIWHADAPRRNLYPYYLSKAVGKHVKVVLGGLGGDELFGGYEWKYQFAEDIESQRRNIPKSALDKLQRDSHALIKYISEYGLPEDIDQFRYLKKLYYLNSNVDLYLSVSSLDEVFVDDYLKNIYGDKLLNAPISPISELFKKYFEKGDFINQILKADYKTKLTDDFLFVDDSMSMANSVESRVPFLDNELVEFAFTVPSHFKFNNYGGKHIFKKAMRQILPRSVINREKRGFGVDVFLRYKNELREYAQQLLSEGNLVKEGLIKKDYIDKILRHHPQPEMAKHYTLIWNLAMFEIWYEMYMKNEDIKRPNLNINDYA